MKASLRALSVFALVLLAAALPAVAAKKKSPTTAGTYIDWQDEDAALIFKAF